MEIRPEMTDTMGTPAIEKNIAPLKGLQVEMPPELKALLGSDFDQAE